MKFTKIQTVGKANKLSEKLKKLLKTLQGGINKTANRKGAMDGQT